MKNSKSRRIFLDHASITPLDLGVKKEMDNAQKTYWANPSSLHEEGELAKSALENARIKIARFLHCRGSEVFFTSGGTEALNLAIWGMVKTATEKSDLKIKKLPHVIVSAIEHPAVLEPVKNLLKQKKIEASFVLPDGKGVINPESIKKELKENTVLVAIQHANSEIGTIQPVREISKILKTHPLTPSPREGGQDRDSSSFFETPPLGGGARGGVSPYLLVDACQSALYEDVSIERLGADMIVLDGIKIYGPRGAGILVIRHGTNISPIVFGGGQESGLRSGTENVASVIGLAKALEIAYQKREKESTRLTELRNYAIEKILKEIPNSSLNGGQENRLPNNINVCFPKQDSEFLVIKLDTLGFAVSAASACHSLSLENSSYVIESLGKSECVSSSLRITLGRDTKMADLDKFITVLKKILK